MMIRSKTMMIMKKKSKKKKNVNNNNNNNNNNTHKDCHKRDKERKERRTHHHHHFHHHVIPSPSCLRPLFPRSLFSTSFSSLIIWSREALRCVPGEGDCSPGRDEWRAGGNKGREKEGEKEGGRERVGQFAYILLSPLVSKYHRINYESIKWRMSVK